MTAQDSFTPQVETTPWVSSLTYPHKANGTLRICMDPRDLNKTIIHKLYKASTGEEITHRLANSTLYSRLYAKNVLEYASHI